MDPASATLLAAGAAAAGAYLNAKFGIGADLEGLRNDRAWGATFARRIEELGDTVTLYAMFDRVDPAIEALWFEGRTWTYGELKQDVLRLAAFFESRGIKKNDVVGLFMTNSPEMIITVLALSKLSAVAGLINTNLRDDTLKHCLNVSSAQFMMSSPDLAEHVVTIPHHFTLNLGSFNDIPVDGDDDGSGIIALNSSNLPTPPPTTISPPAKAIMSDLCALIFTSGTTGKPKACGIRNNQIMVTSNPLPHDLANPSRYFPLRTYSPLPLFHGTGFFTGVCYSIGTSSTICLARKFSSRRFFPDVHASRATRILYVGELCRYLVSSPPTPHDQAHACIVATGNGLRGEIWERFKTRFGIPEIREFYRSTEGVAKFDNFGFGAQRAGRIGFAGPLRRYLETDTFLIRVDPDTGVPRRDPRTGFCVRAAYGEAGEAIGKIKNMAVLTEYLRDPEATQEKVLRDVFVKGDAWQKMGDLIVHDRDGWVRFHDRMGDTFRWKGENVSAGEVRDHLGVLEEVEDAVVYGVKLAGYDGQAGAAALTLSSTQDEHSFMSSLYARLRKTGLPEYAMPRLVRITKEIAANATFKKSKLDMMKKSWVASSNTDSLFWLDGKQYRSLDEPSWRGIEAGKAKL